ncbi:13643_t:CDS:1, partial [Rhizophagus irregularis]
GYYRLKKNSHSRGRLTCHLCGASFDFPSKLKRHLARKNPCISQTSAAMMGSGGQ